MRSTIVKRTIFILVFSLLILFGGELRSEAYSLEEGLRKIETWTAGSNGVKAILYEKEYGDGTLTLVIEGQGEMYDGSLPLVSRENYVSKIKRVQIESGITYIGKNAFSKLTSLESVNIRGDEVRIGEGAFQGLYSLKRVFREKQDDEYCIRFVRGQSVDDRWYKGINVNEIGEGAFTNCVNLKKISIGLTCKKIGIKAFEGCNNLNEVQLDPDSQLEEIGNSAFKGCQSLGSFLFNLNLKRIGANAFASTGLVKIIIQNKKTIIENEAFAGCDARIYGYRGSTAEQYAKENGMGFSHETFETAEGEEIREWDISERKDKSLLAKISESGGHMWLKIELAKEVEGPVRMESFSFDKYNPNIPPWMNSIYSERIEKIEINDGVVSNIGDYAFDGLNNVKEITIPYPVEEIGVGNFYNCNALKKINFPPSLRKLNSTGIEFTGEVTVKGFARTPFESVGGSEKVKIEYYDENYTWNLGNKGEDDDSVIGTLDYVSGRLIISGNGKMKNFQDAKHTSWTEPMHMWQNSYGGWIKEVEIKDDVIYLGNYAFSGLRNITVVMIPKDLGMFGKNIFQGCDKLEQVIFLHTGTQYQLELTNSTFDEMNTNTTIYCIQGTKADEFFENNRDHEHLNGCYDISENDGKSSVIAYLIPFGSDQILYVTGKGHTQSFSDTLQWNYPFNDGDYPPWLRNPTNLGNIKRIIIENGVESIGANVFRCLTYVGKIEIPDSVRKIGNGAFSGRATGAPGDSIELELVLPSQGISEIGSEIFGPSSAYPVSIKTITINNVQGTGNWYNKDEKNNPGGDAIEIKWDVRRRRR